MFSLLESTFQGLSLLPLMEPSIAASLDLFAPFGSSPASDKAQLKGSFGNAVLDNIPDYYSQLLTKVRVAASVAAAVFVRDVRKEENFKNARAFQNNLSNPPTPPSSLPPTPPPSVQHKLLNGVTSAEELSSGQKDKKPAEEPMGKSGTFSHVVFR